MRILLILLFPLTLFAQEVRPPVVTYSQKKVLDSWELRNMSETVPLTVVALTPKTFIIDAKGNPTFADIDPTKISIRLSEHSFRIPPGQTHQTWADIKCLQGPCWVCIFASMVQGRTAKGVQVTLMLPHTVEMQSGTIRKKDIQVSFPTPKTLVIKNVSTGFDRPQIEITSNGKKLVSGLPIFPNGERLIATEEPIEKVKIRFAHFSLNEKP